MKRILSVLLALCLIACALPTFAFAAADRDASGIYETGSDAGKLTIHNVQSETTADYHGAQIPVYTVSAGKLFTKDFEYTAEMKAHNCGDCATIISISEVKLENGKVRSSVYPSEYAELFIEAFINPWNSPESNTVYMEEEDPGVWPRQTGDSYTFSSNSVGKAYGVLIQYFDGTNEANYDIAEFVIQVAKAPTVGGFSDVSETDYFAEPVRWAVEKNITTGTSDTSFSPNQTCTTAQILTFLWRANGKPEPGIANPFSDVTADDYYYKAALWAYEEGLISGAGFGGSAPCTRAQTVTYQWKLAGSPTAPSAGFSDVSDSADYAMAVAWAVQKGVTTGTSSTTFAPDDTCTRGQIVTFLYRDLA